MFSQSLAWYHAEDEALYKTACNVLVYSTVQPQFSCHVNFSFPSDIPSRIHKAGSAVIYIPKFSWLPSFEKPAAEYWPDIQPSEVALGLIDAGPGRQKRGASAGPEVPQGRATATMTMRTLKAPLPYCSYKVPESIFLLNFCYLES